MVSGDSCVCMAWCVCVCVCVRVSGRDLEAALGVVSWVHVEGPLGRLGGERVTESVIIRFSDVHTEESEVPSQKNKKTKKTKKQKKNKKTKLTKKE